MLNWQEALPRYHQEVVSSYTPLQDEYCDLRAEIVRFFDSVFDNKLSKKTDKAKLRYVITDMAMELTEDGKEDLIPVHDKYAGYSFEESEKEADEMVGQTVKAMMEMALGIKLDDDADFSSPEQLAKLLHQKKLEQEEQTISQSIRDGLPQIELLAPSRPGARSGRTRTKNRIHATRQCSLCQKRFTKAIGIATRSRTG